MTEEQKKLVEDHHNLIYWLLHKYGLLIDDYYDIVAIGLCKAAIDYNGVDSSFATCAYVYMRTELRNHWQRKASGRRIPDELLIYYDAECNNIDGTNGVDRNSFSMLERIGSGVSVEDDVLTKINIENILNRLSDRDKLVFYLLNSGYSQREIGKVVGVSQSYVSNLKKKIMMMLLG